MSPSSFDDTLDLVSAVPGWMTPGQARLLWNRAQVVDPGGRVVEIGSFHGRSTILLARAVPPGVDLIAIDPHGSTIRTHEVRNGHEAEADAAHRAFLANLAKAKVLDRVDYHRTSSHAALGRVQGAVDLLYIDGSHNFGPARADILEWGARLRAGGTMLIHDTFTSVGVTLAVLSTLVPGREMRYVGRVGSLAEFRCEPLTGRARLTHGARLLGQLPYFLRNLVVELLLLARLRPLTRYLGYDMSLDWPH